MPGGSFAGPYSGNDSESIEWDLVGKDLTITCWVKIPNNVTWSSLGSFGILGTMADLGNHNSAKSGFSIGAGNTGYPNWHACFAAAITVPGGVASSAKVTVNTTYKGGYQLPITWADDDWHLVTVTYKFGATDANDYQIYFDNAQTLGSTSQTPYTAISTSGWTTIPGRRSGLGGSLTTSGGTTSYKQREFVIWDRILTSAERTTVYNSGVPLGNTASYPSDAVTGWMFENNIDVDPTYYNSQQEYTGRVTLKNAFDNSKYPIVSNYDVFNRIPSSYNSVQTNHISIPQVQNNPGTSSGMTTANLVNSDLTRSIPYSSYSMEFDGAADYVSCGSVDETEGITTMSISGWINPQASGGAGAAGIIAKESRDWYAGWYNAPANSIRFLISDDNGITNDALNSLTLGTNADVLNKWHHFVCTWDASDKLKIYINGVLSSETNSVNANSALPTSTNNVEIGRRVTTYFDGNLSNIAIWTSVLTEDQILTIYNGGVPNDISSLSPVSWWSLAGDSYFNGTDWICPDLGSGGNNGTSSGMGGSELVGDAPGGSANGVATNMDIPTNLKGDAPNSSSNAFSVNMGETDRVESVPS